VARRIVSQFRRDPRTLVLVLVVPIVIIVGVGYVVRHQSPERKIAIVNQTAIPGLDARVAAEISAANKAEGIPLPEDEARRRLTQGRVQAVLVLGGTPGSVSARLTLEGTDPSSASALRQLVTLVLTSLQPSSTGTLASPPALAIDYLHGGPNYDTLDFFAPGLIAYFAFFFIFLLTAVSFLRERVAGTLERLMASPISRGELVVGYILGFGIFAMLQAILVVLAAVLALRIHYTGSLAWVFVVVAVLTLAAVNLGIFLSTYARTELQAVQFIPLVVVPQAIFCGLIWPVSALPGWMQPVSRVFPMTYAIAALRDVMLKGQGLGNGAVGLNILAVLGFAVLFAGLAVGTLRREVV
jgi:ABC-2 type transport system permease protein